MWQCGGKRVAKMWQYATNVVAVMWQHATNVVANALPLYPLKSPSTAGLHTNVGTDFPYALSKYPLVCRFAPSRGI